MVYPVVKKALVIGISDYSFTRRQELIKDNENKQYKPFDDMPKSQKNASAMCELLKLYGYEVTTNLGILDR